MTPAKHSSTLTIRVTPALRKALLAAAAVDERLLSSYIRRLLAVAVGPRHRTTPP